MELRGVMVVEDPRDPEGLKHPERLQALEHVANRPIADHVLEVLRSAGVEEIIVAVSDELAEAVLSSLRPVRSRLGIPVQAVTQPGAFDLSAALRLMAPIVRDTPCIVHTANGLLEEPLAPFLDRLRGDSPDATVFVHQGRAPDAHLNAATQEMLHVAELDPKRAALGMAGVWLFGPGALASVASVTWQSGSDVDLTAVAHRIADVGGSFEVLPVEGWRSYAGDPLDLLELNRVALDRLQTELRSPSDRGNRIEGRVWIHEQASVQASVIVGPTVIGPRARISDAYIGPYTSIGADAQVEGAEIERSIISAGASILHVGGRIVSSVVGRDARVFRDFSVPRALRLRVGDGTEVALC